MDFKEIKELMAEFNESPMRELEIETDGFHIHLSKNENTFKPQVVTTSSLSAPQAETPSPKVEEASEQAQAASYIKAPMVGSIYLQPAPDKEAYVSVGTKVHKGDVVCIIEAMKMMTEIKSEVDGIITKVLVTNEELVEFDQPLFEVQEG
ncbi:acetyl-CoA carboxylase, biotin carboxyl carrier protein [Ligilactobacillus agilis]|uniref:Biotin carboxyl carrier protein of acetyl-CoA carboxylase n=1 Tax=Ligilactobacillus agilis TaxID=1601 RepID=A0A231PW55_9LACO|nr:acetyl-CoA carboxylase biotin carboxyl carrier protein [Ligilactobacillus agilis]OXC10235.1 acetyl-CoA carboxylase, biotin carboxyl carrier protein [Ligilactobacillus agilis]OXC11385.1 acetyl-CoA carboxylase, biotin carboxyl carrier protein [Ligilactobacillus agilis]OXC13269.1 acetyl-CoA carboxylase, biotin carboxyl carrier protein [Ligilactobacillus agilis]OXS38993.1 acetyl-CoA carboxylase, biotin carboxyl carrier protein [Ligilactobacillus agilis]OXS41710.1 acetyl-CoA carboxylase, biotin 